MNAAPATPPAHRAARLALAAAAVLTLTLAGAVARGGELQDLHGELATTRGADGRATDAPPAPAAAKGTVAPEGTAFAPGFGPATEPTPRPGRDIERIGLERTRCLTGCPAFTLVVQRDGSFRWEGEFGVERLGSHRGRIEPGRVQQVMDVVADLGIASLDATYASPFLDNATSYVLVEDAAGVRVIEDQAGAAPPRLWAVEQLIEGLLDYAVWEEPAGATD